jgi:shikimate kinase
MKRPDNIILIGFMGSGKSSVGKLLAKQLNYNYNDTDEMIEVREGIIINEIFSRYGEKYFRELETTLLLSLKNTLEKTVLSTGGGMPIIESNTKLLSMMGQVIYLRTSQSNIINRLSADTTRPLLKGENLKDKVEHLLTQRNSKYEEAADIIIDTDDKSIEDIVREIGGLYEAFNN